VPREPSQSLGGSYSQAMYISARTSRAGHFFKVLLVLHSHKEKVWWFVVCRWATISGMKTLRHLWGRGGGESATRTHGRQEMRGIRVQNLGQNTPCSCLWQIQFEWRATCRQCPSCLMSWPAYITGCIECEAFELHGPLSVPLKPVILPKSARRVHVLASVSTPHNST
jgi:hypothetical protein